MWEVKELDTYTVWDSDKMIADRIESEEVARLIAAAPSMLETLVTVARSLDDMSLAAWVYETIDEAFEAIMRKTEGDEQ